MSEPVMNTLEQLHRPCEPIHCGHTLLADVVHCGACGAAYRCPDVPDNLVMDLVSNRYPRPVTS